MGKNANTKLMIKMLYWNKYPF